MRTVETVVLLVALATVVAAFARRLRVPAPSLLVVVGLAVGMLPRAPAIDVPPEVVSLVVLPPLLYAASEELAWRDLRAVWRPVAVLAVGLVLASAAAVAVVGVAVASLSASMAFVLGAVLASTDPVAVSALARRLSLPVRVFGLIGLELPELVRATGHPGHWLAAALAVTGTLIAVRVAWVFPLSAAYQWRRGTRRPAWPVPAVVSWAGTRGVVPLAAALSIPLTTASGAALPQRDLVLVVTTAAIVISLIAQGFTLEPLARLAGFGQAGGAYSGHEETVARLRLAEAGLARLNELADNGTAPDAVIDRLRARLQARIGTTRDRIDQDPDTEPEALPEKELRADLIAAENAELSRLYEDGTISAATRSRLQRSLDLEVTRLADRQR